MNGNIFVLLPILVLQVNCKLEEIGCFVPGECVLSSFVNANGTASSQDCLRYCQVSNKLNYLDNFRLPFIFSQFFSSVLHIMDVSPKRFWQYRFASQTFDEGNQFTYYEDSQLCVAFEFCTSFSSDSCTNCISGDATCPDQVRLTIVFSIYVALKTFFLILGLLCARHMHWGHCGHSE